MRYIILASILLLTGGCRSITSCFIITKSTSEPTIQDTKLIRTAEYQSEIDALLAADADNKKWERIYIQEIRAAQKNDDIGAYKFFLTEYINIPRYILPNWMKEEPGYAPGVTIKDLENM